MLDRSSPAVSAAEGDRVHVLAGSRSDATDATRHLLRRLREPNSLRADPLAATLLRAENSSATTYDDRELVARIASQISIALTAMHTADPSRPLDERTRRHRSIIARCDLRGEPHKIVAASLGLSMRQFYRERTAALDRLASLLTATPTSPQENPLEDTCEFELHLELLDGLARRCNLTSASQLATEMLAGASRAAERAAVLLRLSYLGGLAGDADGRDRDFRDAASLAAKCEVQAERATLDAELDFLRMIRAWQNGAFGDAAAIGTRLIDGLTIGRMRERARRALLRKSLLTLGIIQQERGDAARSFETFSLAQRAIEPDPSSPTEQRLDALLHLAEARVMVGGDLSRALADTLEVVGVARSDGLPKQLVWGLLRSGMILGFGGDLQGGARHAMLAAQVARGHLAGEWRSVALLRAASIAAAGGSTKDAFALIEEGKAHLASGARAGAFLPLRYAQVLLASGQAEKSRDSAKEARRSWERSESRWFLGESLLVQAKASVLSGDRSAALVQITDALGLLEGATWLPEYGAARALFDAMATRAEDGVHLHRAARGFPSRRAI